MADFKSGVGTNIKLVRKTKGITQEELAEIIGIHPRQLSKIETGDHFPSCKTFEKICMALDIEPKTLFDFEFLIDESEAIMTGTDNISRFQAYKTESSNVYQLYPKSENEEPKHCTDESMAKIAKTMNKPVFVEYFDENKSSKIVVFYPDGKEKVIRNSQDTETKKVLNYMVSEFKKTIKDKNSTEFLLTAMNALKDDKDLAKLESIIYGMKLARGLQ